MGGQCHSPTVVLPGKTRYPLYRRLGGPRVRSGRVQKWTQPTGFRTPDRPSRCKSQRQLCYSGRLLFLKIHFNIISASSHRSPWLSLLFAFFGRHFHTISSTTRIPTQPSSRPNLTPKCRVSKNLPLYTTFYFSESWKSSAGDCKVSWFNEWAINRPVLILQN